MPSYKGCFVCGQENMNGLRARFVYDGERAICEIEPSVQFEGWRGILHGGVTSSLLDEVMIKAVMSSDVYVVTAEMTIKYHHPVPMGQKLIFRGWVTSHRGRYWQTEGEVALADGTVLASSTGKYLAAKADLAQHLKQSSE